MLLIKLIEELRSIELSPKGSSVGRHRRKPSSRDLLEDATNEQPANGITNEQTTEGVATKKPSADSAVVEGSLDAEGTKAKEPTKDEELPLTPRDARLAQWGSFKRTRTSEARQPRTRSTTRTTRKKLSDVPQIPLGEQPQTEVPQVADDGSVALNKQQASQDSSFIPRSANKTAETALTPPAPPKEDLTPLFLSELEEMSRDVLNDFLSKYLRPEDIAGTFRTHDLITKFIRTYICAGGSVITSGVIEIVQEGCGFLRSPKANYLPCPEDVYVAQQFVRRFNLRTGDFIEGPIRDPRERPDRGKEKFLAIGFVKSVNGHPPADWRKVIPFETRTPIYPNKRIQLENYDNQVPSMRIMDMFAPIGFGQRGLIVAPPRTGKTILLQQLANAITKNHPEAYLIALLIDERPEEVTDMQRNTKAHVLSSTFDEEPARHAQVAEMVIEMSKRMAESGKDVIILLDSITRLARAYNTLQPHSGKILSGGVDAEAMFKPKRFFGAARNLENCGSLTIIATALIETGSRMDEVIFEEFKGTGNMELVLDRSLSDKRIYPAINVAASGTRKEELLLHPKELEAIRLVRTAFTNESQDKSLTMRELLKQLEKNKTNAEYLMSFRPPSYWPNR